MPDAMTWTELVVLMVEVPDPEPTIRGAILSVDGDPYQLELSPEGLEQLKRQLAT